MTESARSELPRVPLLIVTVCWLLLLGSYLLPPIPLDGELANLAVYVTQTGSFYVVPGILLAVVALLASRSGLTWKRRLVESIVIVVVMGVLLKGGSWLNEHFLKPTIGVHRPNAVGMEEEQSLGMSLESFYGLPTNRERSDWLKEVLENKYFEGIKLSEPARNHWISEGGFSLPSGHTIGAFIVLSFGLFSTWYLTPGWRFGIACLLAPWAISVSYSRVLLRMHWPNDLIVSGMAGILLGIGFFALFRRILWKDSGKETESEIVESDSALT